MLIVLSPAKTLDFKTPPITSINSMPGFLSDSAELIEQLRELSPPQISELMGISDNLGNLNFGRYLNWSQPFTKDNAKQAVLAFKGDVYTGLQAETLSESGLKWAQNHLRILSGLYGLLRPLDLIQPYRLEMGIKFANNRGKNLYEFWDEKITEELNGTLKESGSKILLNLASNEYFKAIKNQKLNGKIITPVFKDWKNDKYKVISFFAKKARGLMTQYIINNRIKNAEKIKKFNLEGYQYNEALSTEKEWVFTRDEQPSEKLARAKRSKEVA